MIKVLVESPFAGKGDTEEERLADMNANITYARAALNDCFHRGEAPYASHLLFTQEGVLNDDIPEERRLGIDAGLLWGEEAEISVIYLDRGFSTGMGYGLRRAIELNRPFELRVHPLYVGESVIIDAYSDYVRWKRWDSLLPPDAESWVSGIHSELTGAAKSSKMNIAEFLTMLSTRSWE